jgi:hypothetical protein
MMQKSGKVVNRSGHILKGRAMGRFGGMMRIEESPWMLLTWHLVYIYPIHLSGQYEKGGFAVFLDED